MSLARAFTRRLGRGGERAQADSRSPEPALPSRTLIMQANFSDYYYEEDAKARPQISLPMQLTEASNMLAFDAPNIGDLQFLHNVHFPAAAAETSVDSAMSTPYSEAASSSRSSDEKSRSAGSQSSAVTPTNENAPALTDSSSVESSPTAAKNLRNEYFPTAAPQLKRSQTDNIYPSSATSQDAPPAVPRRAPSHSKREHERVARSRSLNRASAQSYTRASTLDSSDETGYDASNGSPSTQRSASPTPEAEWRTSLDILGRSGSLMSRPLREHSADAGSGRNTPSRSLSASRAERRPNHPFSHELEQLNEVAEDITGLDDALEQLQDDEIMVKRGLVKHSADAYLADISPLKGVCFSNGETRIAHVDASGMQGWI